MSRHLFSSFEHVARKFASHTALIDHQSGASMCYADLLDAVQDCANDWSGKVSAGQHVALCLNNTSAFVVSFLALQKLGVVTVLISPALTTTEQERIIRHADVMALVDESGLKRLAAKRKPLVMDNAAVMFYTSGTTGQPKGVVLSHENILENVTLNQICLATTLMDCFISASPFSHVFGLLNVMMTALLSGASLVLIPTFLPRVFLEAITAHQVSVVIAVPTMYQLLLACLPNLNYELASVRVCHSGAAPMPTALIEQIECLFTAPVQEGYGLSEVTSIATSNPLSGTRKAGSIGCALPGLEIQVVDAQGSVLPTGRLGELRVKGKTVMLGYYRDKHKSDEKYRDGWLYTGDIGRQDEDGYFYVSGRQDDMMNLGGYKVYPKEIEEVLNQHPDVQLCAVVGVENSVYCHEVHAFMTTARTETRGLITELQALCKAQLAAYKHPKKYAFVSVLPQTPSGKIKRNQLKELSLAEGSK